ncbi:amino acid transporter AVT1J-like [Tripterygium wilfordii]|uniref:amino acid transporter AVT1J-like n=1 Tax=Tripterygium wilfordii TaxID=458696 RepID=UPI0018F8288A|nr:amino acid transporter AVT1J-like [Tripterygium wilfordii]
MKPRLNHHISATINLPDLLRDTNFGSLDTFSAGVGIPSIPFALSQGGWLGLVLLFLVTILSWCTGLLLQRCMNTDPLIRTYPDIGEQAFGYVGRTLVSVFMCLELYLVAMEFLILEGDNLFKLFPNTNFTISDVKIGGKQGFVMLTSLIILPTTWLRNLGVLAYVSAGRVLASIIVVACVFWAGTVEVVGFHEGDTLFNLTGIPTAISLFTFCYYGHAMFPTHCNSMNNRSQFSKVSDLIIMQIFIHSKLLTLFV